jgi:SNF2 family DNA or RNA helicase
VSKVKYKFKTKPYRYQLRALNKIQTLDGKAGLFMEMGTGKTKVAIDWAGIGYHNYEVKRVLVICPLSVIGVWQRQIKQHLPFFARVRVLTGSTPERAASIRRMIRSPQPTQDWLIINYEGIWRGDGRNRIEDLLEKWGPDLVICDEGHRIKSSTAKQSKAAARIGGFAEQRLVLTGTPITKSPLDIFGQFRFIDSAIFGSNWYRFKNRFGIWGGWGRYQLKGYKHLDELVGKVRGNTFRIKKEQAIDLPEKVFVTVPVELGQKAMDYYRKMAKEMIIEIEETHATAAIVLVKILRLSQITSGFIKDVNDQIRVFDNSKLNVCMDLLDDIIAQQKKVVIFVRFRKDIERIEEAIKKKFKIEPLILSGSVPHNQRDSLIERFQNDDRTKVFIAQIQAGSLGIDLTASSVAIFYSLDYAYANYVQAQDRLHRHGQRNKVTYYHLVVPRTIDALTLTILKDKGDLAHAIVHDPRILRPNGH